MAFSMRRIAGVLALASGLCLPMAQAWSETLNEALAAAYSTNPTILAARANQRGEDERVPAAKSGWRPTVTIESSINRDWIDNEATSTVIETAQGQVAIVLRQPVFRGFATSEGVKSAEARVRAGQQSLFATEQQTLFDAVQAYMNVYAGRQLVDLQKQNVGVLQGQLQASRDRFEVGEITQTDVEQSRASLAQAEANLANAQAQLAGNVARYLQLIGKEPGKLSYPKMAKLPPTLQLALSKAGEINPRILARAFVEEASVRDIKVATAPLLPEIGLEASGTMAGDTLVKNDTRRALSVAAVLNWDLYDGGVASANVRRAKQLASESRIEVVEIAREVRRAVSASWNEYHALGQIITAARTQVNAAELALDGVRQEYDAGTRTTLDVLNAQAAVVQAKTTLVTAERNRVISGYGLLAAVGQLTAGYLALKVQIYDPNVNYDAVKNKIYGTEVEVVE